MNYIPVIILLIVFVLIAVRQIGRYKLRIWQIMTGGALLVLLLGQISFSDAFHAINLDVMVFLFGMFVVGRAIEQSGYLTHLSHKLFVRAKTIDQLVLFILFGFGIASAFLMNDTLAIIGTPVALYLSKQDKISSKLLLLALAFAVTLGSVVSPIGNPQNLLIALHGNMQNPFLEFAKYLLIPTIICLFAAYLILRIAYHKEFKHKRLSAPKEHIVDKKLSRIARTSLILILAMIALKIGITFFYPQIDLKLTYIAVVACLPIILFSNKRFEVLKKIDWPTLLFFASMFVLMACVWNSGVFQAIMTDFKLNITSILAILLVGVLLSQLISNVPLVALYLPLLITAGAGTKEMIALAVGSTIAGNLLILGAASNVIIIQSAENHGKTITFWDFAKVGIPLTIISVVVYWVWLRMI